MTFNIIIAIAIALLSLTAAYIFTPSGKHRTVYAFAVLVAVLARMCIVFYIYRNGTDAFGTDGLLYHQEGIKAASELDAGVSVFSIGYDYTWYTVFVGLIYHLFGVNRYLASFINIVLTVISGLILLRLALNHKYRFTNAAVISLVFLFFPNLLLWTADSRKEALLIFICFLGWFTVQNFTVSLRRGGNPAPDLIRILLICLFMWFSTLIRIYMFIPIFFGIITSQTILYIKTKHRLCLVMAAASAISAVLIFTTVVSPLTENYHAIDFSSRQSGNMLQDMNNKISVVGAIASKRNIFESVFEYLILPLPGKLDINDIKGSPKTELLVRMDMTVWYICLLLVLTGIYTTLKRKDSCFMGLLAFIAAYVLINALVVENVSDTIYRYRSVIVGLVILFIDGGAIREIGRKLGGLIRGYSAGNWLYRH